MLTFRAIQPADVPALLRVRARTRENAICEEGLRALGITPEVIGHNLATTHGGWVCADADEVVGFAIGDGSTGELWVIAVLPEFEGRGVGSRLLVEVEAWLWSRGWDELWLWTDPDETRRACSFYLARGWRRAEAKAGRLYLRKRRPAA